MFADLEAVEPMLAAADSGEPTLRVADRDLYCLIRSDMMLVDLSMPGYGEQGVDVLFGHLGQMPIIGITDRYQNAPALLQRLDCLIAPDSIGQIVRAVMLFGGVNGLASPETNAQAAPANDEPTTPPVTKGFAEDVLRAAGVVRKVDDDHGGQDQVS